MVRAELLLTVRLRHWRLRLCHDMKRDDGARLKDLQLLLTQVGAVRRAAPPQ